MMSFRFWIGNKLAKPIRLNVSQASFPLVFALVVASACSFALQIKRAYAGEWQSASATEAASEALARPNAPQSGVHRAEVRPTELHQAEVQQTDDIQSESSESPRIVVRPIVQLEANVSVITLADLVIRSGLGPELLRKLEEIQIGDAPLAGETRTFTDIGLQPAFTSLVSGMKSGRESGELGGEVLVRIPSRVVVTRTRIPFNAKEVEKALLRHYRAGCESCSFVISNFVLPAGAEEASRSMANWMLRPRDGMAKGAFSVPLEITDRSGVTRTFWVSGRLSVRREVPVLGRSLAIGERVRSEDFSLESRDVTFSTDVPASREDLAASVAIRSLAAGQILWRSTLRRELALKVGDAVKVIAGSDVWQISLDGVSQGAGYIGDTVRVKIPRTQKVVSGILKEKGLVEVKL